MAKGVCQSIVEMVAAGPDPSFLTFFTWTKSIKHFAVPGKGSVIFLDGSIDGVQRKVK